ncbi:hypothetical protein CYLTODRAFT_484637 [Cylindrobasidium torrendii FP15055 ss-10]|uniref:RNA polymerase II elongation factor ELL N-terminal domain-containing protein n=1 Tax=Cylindrobasidium torrendii FP15055 ss-10 TaxID=1314674 RepID=A0A0D7BXF2_9AGAR|nr:hypothetical protein CYLTODRAFT_484637 [Cylindrobasidium torrendii FP15055 ss-10]
MLQPNTSYTLAAKSNQKTSTDLPQERHALSMKLSTPALNALAAQPPPTVEMEFDGPSPGLYVNGTFFPITFAEETGVGRHELFQDKNGTLKSYAVVTGQVHVSQGELSEEVAARVQQSTRAAQEEKQKRTTKMLDVPPPTTSTKAPSKRKVTAPASLPPKPVAPTTSKPSSDQVMSPKETADLRIRIIRTVNYEHRTLTQILDLLAKEKPMSVRDHVQEMFLELCEPDGHGKYKVKDETWLHANPRSWDVRAAERDKLLVAARAALTRLGHSATSPAMQRIAPEPASSSASKAKPSKPSKPVLNAAAARDTSRAPSAMASPALSSSSSSSSRRPGSGHMRNPVPSARPKDDAGPSNLAGPPRPDPRVKQLREEPNPEARTKQRRDSSASDRDIMRDGGSLKRRQPNRNDTDDEEGSHAAQKRRKASDGGALPVTVKREQETKLPPSNKDHRGSAPLPSKDRRDVLPLPSRVAPGPSRPKVTKDQPLTPAPAHGLPKKPTTAYIPPVMKASSSSRSSTTETRRRRETVDYTSSEDESEAPPKKIKRPSTSNTTASTSPTIHKLSVPPMRIAKDKTKLQKYNALYNEYLKVQMTLSEQKGRLLELKEAIQAQNGPVVDEGGDVEALGRDELKALVSRWKDLRGQVIGFWKEHS